MLRMAGMPSLTSTRLSGSDWAQNLLTECANAISQNDFVGAQHLLWVLNELSSPYGSHEQRLAYYFMQALFCKMSQTGPRTHLSLCAAAERRSSSFDSMRKIMLKFQEASPWVTFGHVAANGAMLEALEGESSVHIIDLSSTFCTQWPTLLEALATRAEGAPSVRLTTVVFNEDGESVSFINTVMEEVGVRLEKFARLMGVPFQFNLVQLKELSTLMEEEIAEQHQQASGSMQQRYGRVSDIAGCSGAARMTTHMLAINCVSTLHQIPNTHRRELMCSLQSLRPKMITVVEDMEVYKENGYAERFTEALRFYELYFEALEGSMGKVSNERGALERSAARRIMQRLGCDSAYDDDVDDDSEMQWQEWLQRAGFLPKAFSDDVVDDVKALLKRYKDGWGLIASPPSDDSSPHNFSISLTWRDRNVIFASTWTSS